MPEQLSMHSTSPGMPTFCCARSCQHKYSQLVSRCRHSMQAPPHARPVVRPAFCQHIDGGLAGLRLLRHTTQQLLRLHAGACASATAAATLNSYLPACQQQHQHVQPVRVSPPRPFLLLCSVLPCALPAPPAACPPTCVVAVSLVQCCADPAHACSCCCTTPQGSWQETMALQPLACSRTPRMQLL